jgi:uncharacterized protein
MTDILVADIVSTLIKEFNLKPFQVENTIKLIDDGNTIPFIARYRKEMTGELDDQVLRQFHERLIYLRNLEARKEEVKRLIEEQGKLTEDIVKNLSKAVTLQEIEDIYRPFRPKRRTRATMAREKGLEPLANIIFDQEPLNASIEDIAKTFIDAEKEVNTVEEALKGAMDIIAEEISDNAKFRQDIRKIFMQSGLIVSKSKKEEDSVYNMYYDFSEPVSKIVGHRILAINRGEKEEFLQVKIEVPSEKVIDYLKRNVIKNPPVPASKYIEEAIEDSYERLIFPSVEREVRNELTDTAQEQAMKVFALNLKNLLLQPPVKGKTVMGLDPAYRTGCKIAVVDDTGKVLDVAVVYPTPPQSKIEESKKILTVLINKHNVDLIAIGNGTASKESEIFVADLIKELDREVYYMVVSEAGASVYSASKLAAEEFPNFDVSLRSAVSIARRLQDPLAELVKIDPKAIGVGQYQHDMNQKRLGEELKGVVEDCVNSVGVDLNTASSSLLSYISGINSAVAKGIIRVVRESGEDITKHFKNGACQVLKIANLMKVKKVILKEKSPSCGVYKIYDGSFSGKLIDGSGVTTELLKENGIEVFNEYELEKLL